MSALPEVIPFALPKKPRIREKEPLPDQRKVAVLPFKAVFDERLTPGSLQVLAAVCAYCNRAGITWVSQGRLATELKITRQAVTNQLARLRAAGYVEIMKKGYPGQRCNTLRVIFDSTVDAETAMAVTSRYEDTRPPAIKEEQDRQMYEQPDPAGQARIASLIAKALKSPPTRSKTMPKSGETVTTKKMKEEIAKAKAKRSKPVDKPVDQSTPMDTPECPIDMQSTVSSKASIGHSTVSYLDTPECPITRIEHIRESIKEDSFKELKTVLGNREIDELISQGLSAEQIADSLQTLLPLYRAEGIEPSSAILAEGIRQLQADAR